MRENGKVCVNVLTSRSDETEAGEVPMRDGYARGAADWDAGLLTHKAG